MNEKPVTFDVQIQQNFFNVLTYAGTIAICVMSTVGWRPVYSISTMHGPQLVNEEIWEIRYDVCHVPV